MIEHLDERTLQLHLDDELGPEERAQVELHLWDCTECGAAYQRFAALVEEVSNLPHSMEPPTELWPVIASRIATARSPESPKMKAAAGPGIDLQAASKAGSRSSKQLLVMTWVAGIAAALMAGIGLGRLQTSDRTSLALRTPVSQETAVLVNFDEVEYESAVADLRAILEASRGDLQPQTIRALEENLRIIDQAIADARAAIAADPANEQLHRHLAANMEMKIRMLRTVTGVMSAQI